MRNSTAVSSFALNSIGSSRALNSRSSYPITLCSEVLTVNSLEFRTLLENGFRYRVIKVIEKAGITTNSHTLKMRVSRKQLHNQLLCKFE